MSRQDQTRIELYVDAPGLGPRGIWENKDGGGMDSAATKHWLGNMEGQISLGGRQDIQDITLQRLMVSDRDWALLPQWYAAVGTAECVVSETPLNGQGIPNGKTIVWRGQLKTVTPPPRDAQSTAAAMFVIVISTHDSISSR